MIWRNTELGLKGALTFLVIAATGCESESAPSDSGPNAGAGPVSGVGGGSALPDDAAAAGSPSTGGSGAGGSVDLDPRPGVVVLDGETDLRSCVALCVATTDPAADPEGDDWSTENGEACVIPGTVTGSNQTCTTGETVPEPALENVPGVVVVNNEEGTTTCVPLCVINIDAAADPESDDWSWEDNASCIIPGTDTALNQSCMTLEAIPEPAPRPGVLLYLDSVTECVPVCEHSEPIVDPEEEAWDYENNESCVKPDSEPAAGRRACTYGEWPPDFTPPGLTGTKVKDGFYTEGGRLYDAYGQDFVMRGINNAHAWYDGYAEYQAYEALDDIAATGANTVRVVWETKGNAALLAEILYRIVELEMVPMVEIHDTTGLLTAQPLIDNAAYCTRESVLPVLQAFREYLLINIGNEWSGDDWAGGDIYRETYQTVIASLRAAGLTHTLVIDAGGYGQGADTIFDNASALLEADPEHNLLFSVHMYTSYPEPSAVEAVLDEAIASSTPLIVGEFGNNLNGVDVAWQAIMTGCETRNLGYLAWSWTGNNEDTEHLDMVEDWEGALTTWGNDVINGTDGIAQTAEKASIFE